jgi:lysyl-tRNA synthetase class 2
MIEQILKEYKEGEIVRVHGRVIFVRAQGKINFVKIRDITGTIQIVIQAKIPLPGLWDIIFVQGTCRNTKAGEKSIWTDEWVLEARCEGDRPEKFHGLSDTNEDKFKKHYLEIISNPESASRLRMRSRIIRHIREKLWSYGYEEIETPMLSEAATGAKAEVFSTHHNAFGKDMVLRIATEVALKKALVAGWDKVFEIGRIFRNEGIDRTHNPEFTSIELYSKFGTLAGMKRVLETIIFGILWEDSFENKVNIPNTFFKEYEHDALVAEHGQDYQSKLIEPCFVTGQPIEETPLCSRREDGKANRFEFYANGIEIADAYQELTNWREQEAVLAGSLDDGLTEALKYGLPPTSGMGIGIDRLVMWLSQAESIKETIFLPR